MIGCIGLSTVCTFIAWYNPVWGLNASPEDEEPAANAEAGAVASCVGGGSWYEYPIG